jgi:hypothetical protein
MLERGIIIPNPQLNTDAYRGWGMYDPLVDRLGAVLQISSISPATHPKAIDLASGDGALAIKLIGLGWKPQDITCVDIAMPNPPMGEGMLWRYWDVDGLGYALAQHNSIPEEIQRLQGRFDVVTTHFGGNGTGFRYEGTVVDYLARDRAFLWINGHHYVKGVDQFPKSWK